MKKQIFATIIVCLCTLAMTFSLAWADTTYPVHFYWGASTGQVDGYRIYHGDVQGGPYPNQLCEVDGTILDYVASLNGEREYYLVCRAFNAYGESGNSNEVHWSYVVPGIPGGLYWSIDLAELMKNLGADRIQFVSRP